MGYGGFGTILDIQESVKQDTEFFERKLFVGFEIGAKIGVRPQERHTRKSQVGQLAIEMEERSMSLSADKESQVGLFGVQRGF